MSKLLRKVLILIASYRLSVKHLTSLFVLAILLNVFLPAGKIYAQTSQVKFSTLTTKDGLLANTINTVCKDRRGFLWIGTDKGLNRYDGKEFKVYELVEPGERSRSTEINVLLEDATGRLWAGTMNSGLFYYDPMEDAFISLTYKHKERRLSHPQINTLCNGAAGMLWVGTVNGLDRINTKSMRVEHMQQGQQLLNKLSTRIITNLFSDSSNKLWIGTFAGLYSFSASTQSLLSYRHDKGNRASIVSDSVYAVKQDKLGRIWVGTLNGLSRLNPDNKTFTHFRYSEQDPQTLCGSMVYSIAASDQENLWVGTEGGLNQINISSGKVVRYQHDPRNPYSLNNKSVRSLCVDPQGILWIGSYMGGLSKYDKNQTLFNVVRSSEVDPNGLNAPFISAFAQADGGRIYVGTDGGGLKLYDPKSKHFSQVPIKSTVKMNTGGLPILNLLMDSRKNLWIGTYQHGLFKLNTVTGQYTQYSKDAGAIKISQNDIFSLKEDHTGKIWIGLNGMGVDVLNPVSQKLERMRPWFAEGLAGTPMPSNGYIRAIEEDRDGNIWIGSAGTGISVYNPKSHTFKVYDSNNTRLPIQNVLALMPDRNGDMWIGTAGDGLFRYEYRTQRIVAFRYNSQLPDKVICKILQDENGSIWFSTNKGICSVIENGAKLNPYSLANGLQSDAFMNGSGLRSADGTLYFGGVEGFNYLSTADIKVNRRAPHVVLTTLNIDNKRIAPNQKDLLPKNISELKKVTLQYKQDFSISFVALNYTLPQQNKYSFYLQGFNKSWSNASNVTTAHYTNLDPGEYTFYVKAANNDGIWNKTYASIQIVVLPPIWMTWYAYAFYLCVVLAGLLLIRRRGIRKIKTEMQVQQMKREAESRHELDNMKIKFLTNISHEFRTPISLILAPADKLLSKYDDRQIVDQVHVIKRNARRLLNLVNQLLDFKKVEDHELKLNLTDGEIVSFVKDITDSFKDLADSKKIKYYVVCGEQKVFVKFDGDKIERMLFNLLSNAFKFTPAGGSVSVDLTELKYNSTTQTHTMCIMVSDTGIGMPKSDIPFVFDRFYQANGPTSIINQGSGIGLSITKELVVVHGGEIRVNSEIGKGTTFEIILPLSGIDVEMKEALGGSAALVREEALPVNVAKETGSLIGELPHVLIIEDNDELRYYLVDNLKEHYRTLEAVDGRDGWNKALSGHPDLIISDISMPYMDGLALSQKLKGDKRTSHIPVILLTALSGQEEQLAGLESGATDYLTKPLNFSLLAIKIRNLLALNRQFKETYQRQIKVSPADKEFESASEKFINNVALFIEKNLTNAGFSVGDLSEHFGMSRGSLYTKVLELTGKSPIDFIRDIKLTHAATLLEKSELSISEIAYSSGFSTPHYFAKSFKAKFHMLPSQYRATKAKKDTIDFKAISN